MKISKTIKILASFAVVTGMMFTSCKKDSGTSSTLGIKIQATNKTYSFLKSASVMNSSFIWDTCYMYVSKVHFEAEQKESDTSKDSMNIDFEWKGPKKIDLFSINSLIGEISLQPGIYEEVSIKVEAKKSDAGTSPVFYLAGTFTNANGVIFPIVVIINEDFEFEIEAKDGTLLNAVNNYSSLVNFNLTLLMHGIMQSELTEATLTNGKIIISISSNNSIYVKIKANLSSCEDSEFNEE